ncbi:MAG: MFS transporter [Clostridia bacterium]|nr:MFS transporter [Clostridia bacterium]
MQIINKAKDFISDAVVYWKKPPVGNYINYRSIFGYSVGGIGVYAIIYLYTTITVTGTNVIISNATGIAPEQLLVMYYVTFFMSIFLTGIRAKMIDSVRNRKGKYRPYILSMGIPTAVLAVLIVWVPYGRIESYVLKWIIVFILNLGLQFTYGFLYDAYENLIFVMSPNTQERSNVVSIKSVVYSFAPTVLNPLIPLLQKLLHAEDMYDITIYRTLYPITAIIGAVLTVLVYAWTQENIVQAKTHVVQIRFLDALRAVAKNKYFWIISLAGWIGFLESTQGYVLGWLYNYGQLCTPGQYSIITIITGNASLWGMIAAPFAIKRWGKKKVLIVTNAFNILFIALMYPSIKFAGSIWLVMICLYMNAVVGSFAHILTPSINADIRDYQHYISGERIDGMFAAVGLIGSFVTLITGTVTPLIFSAYGINDNNGYENAYDILKYDSETLYSLIYLLIILSIIGATLNVIPFFFYDLSEVKQKAMIRILKIRALFEDYGNNAVNDGELVEAVDLVRKVRENVAAEPLTIDKSLIADAKAHGKEELKAAKKELRARKEFNEEIEIALMVQNELNKFSTRPVQIQLQKAKETYALGLQGAFSFSDTLLKEAKALPKTTEEEKLVRSNAISLAKDARIAKRCAKKNFPNGITEYDSGIFSVLFDKADEIDATLENLYKEKYIAKDAKDKERLKAVEEKIKAVKEEKKLNEKAIKEETTKNAIFNRAAKPYMDAKKLIAQEENYNHLADIEALYDEAKARYEEKCRIEAEEAARLDEARKAEKEAMKAAKRK